MLAETCIIFSERPLMMVVLQAVERGSSVLSNYLITSAKNSQSIEERKAMQKEMLYLSIISKNE